MAILKGDEMRKITKEAVQAFFAGENFSKDNTVIYCHGIKIVMLLHGNLIAKREGDKIKINNCGWKTKTTKERLNGILDYLKKDRIYQKAGIWYWENNLEFKDGWNEVIL